MGLLAQVGWRILKSMPPLMSWRILHSTPYILIDALASLDKRTKLPVIETEFLGYKLNNPIGIAPGLDKDGLLIKASHLMGAGFHVVGSVLPHKFRGVKPKFLFRLADNGTINRLGLPSPGPTPVIDRIKRERSYTDMPIAVSIASLTLKGFGEVYRSVKHVASWVELNISCPNIEEHGNFEDPGIVLDICEYMKPLDKPVLLKIPRTTNRRLIKQYVDASLECGFKGIVAANTLKVNIGAYNAGYGGSWLFKSTIKMVRFIRNYAPDEFKIVASGGIDSGYKAYKALAEGANLVEILSVLVSRGPRALADIVRELYEIASKYGIPGQRIPSSNKGALKLLRPQISH